MCAWDYMKGPKRSGSAARSAPEIRRRRSCYEGSMRNLEEILRRLNTDHLDLWQLHDLRSFDELDVIFGKGCALEALLQAREEGRVPSTKGAL